MYRHDQDGYDKLVRGLLASISKARRRSEEAWEAGVAQLAKCLINRDMNGAIGIVIRLLFNPPVYDTKDGRSLTKQRGRIRISHGDVDIEVRNQNSALISTLGLQLSRQMGRLARSLNNQTLERMTVEELVQDSFWTNHRELTIHVDICALSDLANGEQTWERVRRNFMPQLSPGNSVSWIPRQFRRCTAIGSEYLFMPSYFKTDGGRREFVGVHRITREGLITFVVFTPDERVFLAVKEVIENKTTLHLTGEEMNEDLTRELPREYTSGREAEWIQPQYPPGYSDKPDRNSDGLIMILELAVFATMVVVERKPIDLCLLRLYQSRSYSYESELRGLTMFVSQPWNQLFSSNSNLPTWIEEVIQGLPPTDDDISESAGNAVVEEATVEESAVNVEANDSVGDGGAEDPAQFNNDQDSFASSDYGDGVGAEFNIVNVQHLPAAADHEAAGNEAAETSADEGADHEAAGDEAAGNEAGAQYKDVADLLARMVEGMYISRRQEVDRRVHASHLYEVVLIDVVPISDEGYFVIPDVPPAIEYSEQFVQISLNSKKRRPNSEAFLDISPRQRKTRRTLY